MSVSNEAKAMAKKSSSPTTTSTTTLASNASTAGSYVGHLSTSSGVYSTASSAPKSYYSYYNSWSVDGEPIENTLETNLSEDVIKKIIEKIFDGDTDLLPLVKNYLIKYLDSIMDNPDEIIKDLIKEKDEEINNLKQQVEDLGKKVEELEKKVDNPIGGYDWEKITTNPADAVWIGEDPSTWTTTSISNISSSSTILGPGSSSLYEYYMDAGTEKADMSCVSQTDSYETLTNKIASRLSALKNSTSESG